MSGREARVSGESWDPSGRGVGPVRTSATTPEPRGRPSEPDDGDGLPTDSGRAAGRDRFEPCGGEGGSNRVVGRGSSAPRGVSPSARRGKRSRCSVSPPATGPPGLRESHARSNTMTDGHARASCRERSSPIERPLASTDSPVRAGAGPCPVFTAAHVAQGPRYPHACRRSPSPSIQRSPMSSR